MQVARMTSWRASGGDRALAGAARALSAAGRVAQHLERMQSARITPQPALAARPRPSACARGPAVPPGPELRVRRKRSTAMAQTLPAGLDAGVAKAVSGCVAAVSSGAAASAWSPAVVAGAIAAAAVVAMMTVGRGVLKTLARRVLWPGFGSASSEATMQSAPGCPFMRVPESLGAPIFGHTAEFLPAKREGWLYRMTKTFGDVFNFSIFGLYTTVVASPELYRGVLNSPNVASRSSTAVLSLIGEHQLLLSGEGDAHKRMREALSQPFEMASMRRYVPDIAAITAEHVRRVAAACEAGNEPVQLLKEFKEITFRVIANAVLELKLTDDEVEAFSEDYTELMSGFGAVFRYDLPGTKWRRVMDARRRICARIDPIVERAEKELEGGLPESEWTLLHRTIKLNEIEGVDMPDPKAAVRDTVVGFLFAGHDTTAYSITMLWWHLALRPEWLDRLRREQQAVIEQHGEALSPAARSAMRELDAASRETLRVKPVALMVDRDVTEDFELEGVRFKKGGKIACMMAALHVNDPKLSQGNESEPQGDEPPAHMDFEHGWQPARWLSPVSRPEAYEPWGAGPHMCLGLNLAYTEMKVISAELLRRWDVDVRDASIKWQPSVFPAPAHGLPAVIKERAVVPEAVAAPA
ncbi:unnamed protein product [Pedinophyceae sp. YPF-701]|nr:unnamed protein product [Pedinophyceae sp. YPF-701]